MKYFYIFVLVMVAMIAMSFWEAYVEGRNAWGKDKCGWSFNIGKYEVTGYHFFVLVIMFPSLLSLPLVFSGWDKELFIVLLISYVLGLILEDFLWYVVNPKVKFSEWFTDFSDYYPWIKISDQKILPLFYVIGFLLSGIMYYTFLK